MCAEVVWEILNPTAEYEVEKCAVAPRAMSLEKRRVGLFWNGKVGGNALLHSLEKILKQQGHDINFIMFELTTGIGNEKIRQIAERCDAVIGAIDDCGSCTPWLIRDSIGIEKHGVPAMAIVTDVFQEVAEWIADAEGMAQLPITTIPHPLIGLSEDKINKRAQAILKEVILGLTRTDHKEESRVTTKLVKPDPEILVISGKTNTAALREVNDRFYGEKWTDGFPIVPPTQEAVEWMLGGTKRFPEEVIGFVPPRNGKATVRQIAINAVMAGAEPSYMPVIITSVEAITDPFKMINPFDD